MRLKKGAMTPMERSFAKRFAETGDALYAAEKAGYKAPQVSAYQLKDNPTVMAEARKIAQHALATQILPAATARHMKFLTDPESKGAPLIGAIKLAYQFALVDSPDLANKPVDEMTPHELNKLRDAAVRRLAELAKPVIDGEIAQSAPNSGSQAVDIFD